MHMTADFNYTLFSACYQHLCLLVGMHSGPTTTHPAGWPTTRGLAALLRIWAQDRAHHQHFPGSAAALRHLYPPDGLTRVWLHMIRSWHAHGHLYERWGAYVHKAQRIHALTIRVH